MGVQAGYFGGRLLGPSDEVEMRNEGGVPRNNS